MLLSALSLCFALTLIATTLAQIAVLTARGDANHTVASLLDSGYRHGIAAFQGAVSAGAHLDPNSGNYVLPEYSQNERIAVPALWIGTYRVDDTLTVAGVQGTGLRGPDAAPNSQHADKLAEERISLRIESVVVAPNTEGIAARRTVFVTLRLFGQRPFSEVAGMLPADAADPAGFKSTAHEGDSGGDTFPLENGEIAPGDTGLHLVFKCFGNVNNCQFSNPPVDRGYHGSGFGEVHWTTNNVNATHWSY
jgi:hypothetical protein